MANRFKYEKDDIKFAPCISCKHKHRGKNTCEAFPLGIPDEITFGENDHREQFKGDHNIQYERMRTE